MQLPQKGEPRSRDWPSLSAVSQQAQHRRPWAMLASHYQVQQQQQQQQ
jgi:hypothetical protein